jgi:hypothetical protein
MKMDALVGVMFGLAACSLWDMYRMATGAGVFYGGLGVVELAIARELAVWLFVKDRP